MGCKDSPNHIFIDVGSKCFVDPLRDPWASEAWITSFKFNNGLDEFPRRTLGTWLSYAAR
jgi:hypothetical protein